MPTRSFIIALLGGVVKVLEVLRLNQLRAQHAMETETCHSSTRQGRRRSDLRVQILNALKLKETYDLQELVKVWLLIHTPGTKSFLKSTDSAEKANYSWYPGAMAYTVTLPSRTHANFSMPIPDQ